MRVITGAARGRRLVTLEGEEVRPTTEKVKEAVFSAIQFELEGRRFLDLFAGSGQMGIEALSRGAADCVFVDFSRQAVGIIEENLRHTGLEDRASVLNADAAKFIRNTAETFDVVFIDPPYGKNLVGAVLPDAVDHTKKTGVIVCETESGAELPETVGCFVRDRVKKYGKTGVVIYRVKTESEET
ncbi:MAG: 16S rRNA (guanine(966)-N(2))-methyltransferase RsmD [Clostridia bacterium]|nr:16S rRNA (guanine(966)-N(2))-methyltransferase RsmD [Clostridia bacterium]